VDAAFVSVETARDELEAWESSSERVVVLTRDVSTMKRLARDGGLDGREVNIGGIHHGPGRTRVLRYVFLSDGERDELEEIARRGARVVARDVPGARGVELEDLVGDS
jgi:mannose/fructose/N-acetylgalactosamine-specific phosphotransferase system component IIB